MAIVERASDPLDAIVDEVARAFANHGVKKGPIGSNKGTLRVDLELDVRRIIQAYWTPFQADVPGRSIGLHLEVREPRLHWAEAYLTNNFRNWVFIFGERPDGEVQLLKYGDYADPLETLEEFFTQAAWYVLTACDLTWPDVSFWVSDDVPWHLDDEVRAGATTNAALDESLKKSTIVWLRWKDDAGAERTLPVWYINDKSTLYVLSGERQQVVPGAEKIRHCDVIFRQKGKNNRVGEVPASVRVLPLGSDWDTIAEKIAEKRLNIPGLPEETAKRWRDSCHILEISLHS